MNEWERELKELASEPGAIPHHYQVRPGKCGPNIHCGLCGTKIVSEGTTYLNELVEEAMAHELNNH